MKIEIESNDLTRLQDEVSKQDREIDELKDKLKSLDEDTLKKQAVHLSERMLHTIMDRIFKELGFRVFKSHSRQWSFEELESHLGPKWVDSEKLKVELGATISTHFNQAFLELGIKSDKDKI